LGCPPEKITVVHNGIKLPVQAAQHITTSLFDFGLPEKLFIIGITGQMTETKGHEDVLEAFALAYQKILH